MSQELPQDNEPGKSRTNYLKYTNIALQLGISIAAGVWGGLAIDRQVGHGHLWTAILSIVGVFVGLTLVLRQVFRDQANENSKK